MNEPNLEGHIQDYRHSQHRQTAITKAPNLSGLINTIEVFVLTQSPGQVSPITQLFQAALFQPAPSIWGFHQHLQPRKPPEP